MKQYIALEDVNKPQAEVVTDVEICREFGKETIKRWREHNHIGSERGFASIMSELLVEMEEE